MSWNYWKCGKCGREYPVSEELDKKFLRHNIRYPICNRCKGKTMTSFGVEIKDRTSYGLSCPKCKYPIYEHIFNGETFLLEVVPARFLRDHNPETGEDFVFIGYREHKCEKET